MLLLFCYVIVIAILIIFTLVDFIRLDPTLHLGTKEYSSVN